MVRTLRGEWVWEGEPSCVRGTLSSGAAMKRAMSSSLFYWLQQLICYPLYKLCIYKI